MPDDDGTKIRTFLPFVNSLLRERKNFGVADEFHKTERELLVKTTMQRVAARKSAPGSPEALAVSNSILIPIVPDILHVVVFGHSIIKIFLHGNLV